ncbi:metal-dependent hydrolase [Colwellia sp. MB3u-70]|uniref:metal-dependent hydrolase n=1 Tax=unclassified Colwellia TaxID=196834 RepID=UPI0015F4A169|nr:MULTISPECIES: metal-dependent hydrolase [unclassified Colwellia]MBA6293148.1 metal-dependent hydrolase [Colwellia sp. MB3u-8]MBA6307080.1 metal-dependent hydrolase [Colwellia sp. MB3u-70]
MDSLTQAVLGGAVGYAVLGNKIGHKAAIYGAILGTLPDLDVFLPYSGEVEAFTYHRGFSHSLLIHLLISPFIVWLLIKCHQATAIYKTHWFWLVFLCLSTHAILDSFTVYGTQLLWPITEYPFAVSNLFIIDPMYTLPLLFAFVVIFLPKIKPAKVAKINHFALAISCFYICWSLTAKFYIDKKVTIALNDRQIKVDHYLSAPAPFSTLLWRVLVMSDGQYYEGYLSVFDSASDVSLDAYHSSDVLLTNIKDEWNVQRLQWFTKGFYSVKAVEQNIVLSDLRMGAECRYVFNFILGEQTSAGIVKSHVEKVSDRPDLSMLASVWDRIWDASVSLAPLKKSGVCVNRES